jgi:colanic acid/amylovoran biosynthesis glycosyltransferase
MKSSRRIYFFTNNYPYGLGESWKSNELKILINYFERIEVVPFSYPSNGSKESVKPVDGVVYHLPILPDGISKKPIYLKLIGILFSTHIFYFLREFFRKKLFTSKIKTIRWIGASHKALQLKQSLVLKNIFSLTPNDSIHYFYWGRESAEALPLFRRNAKARRIVRFHGYDLYRDVNEGYLPFQDSIMESIDLGLACSNNGLNTLYAYYPKLKDRFLLQRIGVAPIKTSQQSNDGIFRILSCSRIVEVKRVHLIFEIIKSFDFKIEWTHIGDGPGFKNIKSMTSGNLNPNLTIQLLGQFTPKQVGEYYEQYPVDLFLNVSESEGVPVSVMEALASGIPVMATNVGGTSEIIDSEVGYLLDKDFAFNDASEKIIDYVKKPFEEKLKYRSNAFKKYNQMCKAEELTNELIKIFLR